LESFALVPVVLMASGNVTASEGLPSSLVLHLSSFINNLHVIVYLFAYFQWVRQQSMFSPDYTLWVAHAVGRTAMSIVARWYV
jgi:hypothetical protein